MHRHSKDVSTKRQRIAKLAKQSPQTSFTSLSHLIDLDWLHEAYRCTRKDGAVGVALRLSETEREIGEVSQGGEVKIAIEIEVARLDVEGAVHWVKGPPDRV